jgi:hypothetical protein
MESLKAHESSTFHKKNQVHYEHKKFADTQAKEQSEACRALLMLKEGMRTRMTTLFRNAHAIARMNRPYTDYVWLCHLDATKGNLDLGVSSTYINKLVLNLSLTLQSMSIRRHCKRTMIANLSVSSAMGPQILRLKRQK